MKKTVVFDFPDDFKFPPEFTDRICYQTRGDKPVVFCPFYVSEDEWGGSSCMLTGGDEADRKPCPFYGGAETVNYGDC